MHQQEISCTIKNHNRSIFSGDLPSWRAFICFDQLAPWRQNWPALNPPLPANPPVVGYVSSGPVMLRRVERARFLLEKTALPLADIALDLGFVSQSHFTSVFHREMRTTPQAYRSFFRKSTRGVDSA